MLLNQIWPRVANGKVYIGNGGAEYGVRGYVTEYDAVSGDQVWRFYTVPGDPNIFILPSATFGDASDDTESPLSMILLNTYWYSSSSFSSATTNPDGILLVSSIGKHVVIFTCLLQNACMSTQIGSRMNAFDPRMSCSGFV